MSRFTMVESEYALLEGELHEGNIFLHVTIKEDVEFTPSVYKQMRATWEEICCELSSKDIVELFSFITTDSKKLHKWQKMFGLKPILTTKSHVLYRIII